MIRRMLLVIAFCAVAASASADTVYRVFAFGKFNASAPVSDFSSPNTQWGLSFDIGIGSPVTGVDGYGFNVTFTNFLYCLHGYCGTKVPTADPNPIRFYTFDLDGLFDIQSLLSTQHSDSFTIALFGKQAFTGTTDNPTLTAGIYPVTGGGFMLNGQPSFQDPQGSRVIITTVQLGSGPEPPSGVLLGSALPLLGFAWRMRRGLSQQTTSFFKFR